MAQGVPKTIINHSQRVCRLYKKASRTTEMWCNQKAEFRYQVTLLRDRFDQSRKETDMRKLASMVIAGEEEVFLAQHPQPFFFKNDPGGILYQRVANPSDTVLDYWHPWEKAQYMDYFETREKRKSEYVNYYENAILAKGEKDTSKGEFPVKGKLV